MNPRTARIRYQVYVWTVFLGAIVTLVALSEGMAGLGTAIDSGSYFALWATMILVAAMSPLPLPWGTKTASLTTALDFAAILLFGPAVACWIGVLSRLITNATQRWNPFLPGVLGIGQIVLAVGASGWVYSALGGHFGADLVIDTDQVLPLCAAIATYVGVKGLVAGTGSALAAVTRRRQAFGSWFEDHLAGDLVVLPVGPLLALTQVRIGPVGVALFLLPLAFARYVFNLWAQTKAGHLHMVRVLMSAVDAADPFTRDHSYRVSRMSLKVGRHLGMRAGALEELEFAALLHDIGRTAIQRDVLVKRGKLTEQEMLQMQVHPKIGADMLSGLRFFPGAGAIVHGHHEQPDGKGYPRGLAGEAVPLGSRIIMAVAAFDAMTSDRPYRRGLSPDEALEELLAHSGTQFFPDVVEALIHLYAAGTLFAEFDEAHLERYREGHEHSRAVEAHLKRLGSGAGVPEKAGTTGVTGKKRANIVPVIELTSEAPTMSKFEQTIPLKAKGTWNLEVAAQSDLGCSRKNNEDSYGVFQYEDTARGCVLVLADGMGGALAGEVASRLAVDTVGEAYEQWKKRGQTREALSHAIKTANQSVHAQAASDAQFAGMGTTCTTAAIVGLELTLGHVGDSRAYLVRGGAIEQISQDHTLAGELARVAGASGVAVPDGSSHMLTRCIGAQPEVEIDLSPKPVQLEDGARIVLCSDGLSNEVEPHEILEAVMADGPAAACEALVELARARGGADNITLVVAQLRKS